ncbi:MAG: hypothetical protein ACRERV_02135, partial [Methylococcales bacterium]
MSEAELEPIGIHDQTTSWGIWFHDWNAKESEPTLVPHLIVSPFHLDYWPVLVRIELRLDWSAGTLARATEVLMNAKLNILSINKTETGYRHSTATIIGEAEEVRSKEFKQFSAQFVELQAVHENPGKPQELRDQINDQINKVLAPKMLKFVKGLRKQLYDAHREIPFLREQYIHKWDDDGFGVEQDENKPIILYNPSKLPSEIQDEGQYQRIKVVRCDWLQNLAKFWVYGKRRELIKFAYDKKGEILNIDSKKRQTFRVNLSELKFPFKTIASINTQEHYVRFLFSRRDSGWVTKIVNIPYEINYNSDIITSRGFQHKIYSALSTLSKEKITLRHVSMQ